MSSKQPMQANGAGTRKGAPDGVSQPESGGRGDGGQDGGGHYDNPHDHKADKGKKSGVLGTGGQTGHEEG